MINRKSISMIVLAFSLILSGCARGDVEPSKTSIPKIIITTTTSTQPSETEDPNRSLHEKPDINPNGNVVILMTGDVHCGMDKGFSYGGLYEIRYQMEVKGDTVLLVDSGDAIQGSPIGYYSRGEVMINLMNAMDYDVAIPGEYEFHYGMERFYELAQMARFEYVCCNFVKDGKLVLKPYVIKEACGKKIAFVGVTTPKTITMAPAESFQDESGNYVYGFMQDDTGDTISKAVQNAVDKARAEGAQYVVLVGHIGNDQKSAPWTYNTVVSKVKGIDVYLDGHSHDTKVEEVICADGKKIQRIPAGTKLNCIGWVRIAKKDGKVTSGVYTWSDSNTLTAPEMLDFENPMTKKVDEVKRENAVKNPWSLN